MPDFPLPLAAFEEYMLCDDRPQYPMNIIARLRFAGQLDRRATAEALETVVRATPCCEPRFARPRRADWNGSRRQIVLPQFHGSTTRKAIASPRWDRSTFFLNRD